MILPPPSLVILDQLWESLHLRLGCQTEKGTTSDVGTEWDSTWRHSGRPGAQRGLHLWSVTITSHDSLRHPLSHQFFPHLVWVLYGTHLSPESLLFAKCWDSVFGSMVSCSPSSPLVKTVVDTYGEITTCWLHYFLGSSIITPKLVPHKTALSLSLFRANHPPYSSFHPATKV